MAKKKPLPRRTFHEVVFQGKPKVVRAFLKGLVMGVLDDSVIFYSYLDGIFHEGKAEKLAEMVGIRGLDCHVVVDSKTGALLKKNAKLIARDTGLEIVSHRSVKSSRMFFSFQAFAPRYNDEIVDAVKNLPAGLKIDGFEHEVKLAPEAKGIEAYSPVHHYEATGQATVVGRIDQMVELKREFDRMPLIQCEDIYLELS